MLTDILVNFFHAAAVVFGLLTLLWSISVAVKDASLVDVFWGFGFLCVGAVCLYLADPVTPYLWLLGLLPVIWGARLTIYLAMRNLGHGEDKRYVAMRKRSKLNEAAWRLRSLFSIYWGQGLLIMIVSAPVWVSMGTHVAGRVINSGDEAIYIHANAYINLLAVLGTLLWLIGFLFEAIGDWQLSRFMKKHKDYDGPEEDKPVLNTGLWRYTRHPNYFGNACMWWGIWLVACEAPWGWATIFAPIIMTYLLTNVSGKDLLEKDMGKRKNYQLYIKRTSGFFPLPPKSKSEVE
jgi:steroid 5-alpha reductase family enzyme